MNLSKTYFFRIVCEAPVKPAVHTDTETEFLCLCGLYVKLGLYVKTRDFSLHCPWKGFADLHAC